MTTVARQRDYFFFLVLPAGFGACVSNRSVAAGSTAFDMGAALGGFAAAAGGAGWFLAENLIAMSMLCPELCGGACDSASAGEPRPGLAHNAPGETEKAVLRPLAAADSTGFRALTALYMIVLSIGSIS